MLLARRTPCAHATSAPVARTAFVAACILLAASRGGAQDPQEAALLFHLSADRGLTADLAAGGDPEPNFASNVEVVPDGARGPALQCGHTQLLSYWAPGNIYAERGTLAFFWRSREPVGPTAFPIFRVGYADHSSWDMVWLRIDYNGGPGFDAFVTDAGLSRLRVSHRMPSFPEPKQWTHLALAWDETRGIRFYVDGRRVGSVDTTVTLGAALDQFGPHSRIISPYQVQSAYNFVRGGDIDEVRIYDRMLSDENVAALARGGVPETIPEITRRLDVPQWRDEWWHRYGWNRPGDAPPVLDAPAVSIRKVEIHDAYDLKRWWWKGTDGIRETTWPGVYNRSRLAGRSDYFQLPDWDCYSLSGRSVQFVLPDEPWNHLEIAGAAFGSLSLVPKGVMPEDPTATRGATTGIAATPLFERPKGQERTFHRLAAPVTGQQVRFTNVEPETPIGEFAAYHVSAAREPAGTARLTYRLTALVLTDLLAVDPGHARGREYWYEYNREQPRPETALSEPPPGVPRWAFRQVEYLRYVKRFVNWFIDHRQLENGEFGGGLSDDGDLTNSWPGTAMMGATPQKIRTSLLKEMEAFYAQGMFTNGLSTIQTDELHSYEEGIQVLGQAMLLDFGGPAHLERAMETARALERLTGVNAAGHRHIRSSYFSGTTMATEGVWGWSKPSSYLALHPAIALVDFNGAPQVRRWLIELADGLLAHYKPDGKGGVALRPAIRFETDEDLPFAAGERTWPLLWAAYRWTGDRRYLEPMLDAGPRGLSGIAANALDVLGLREVAGPQVLEAARASTDPFVRHLAWQVSGDRTYLEELYEDQIRAAAAREYINTLGSVWTDRAQINHAELQRARLGGVALTRNAYVPGQAVSWTFDGAGDDERVAVLVPIATPTRLRIIAHNLGATPVLARLRAWDIEPGTWRLAQAAGPDPDVLPGTAADTRTIEWGRSDDLELRLVPGVASVYEFALVKKGTPYRARPDLGIGEKDVQVSGRQMTVTVHSLGVVDAPAARLILRDRAGAELARARVPGMKAWSGPSPVTARVVLSLPPRADLDRAVVTLEGSGGKPEITTMNNRVRLP